jgi:hypothetical protein
MRSLTHPRKMRAVTAVMVAVAGLVAMAAAAPVEASVYGAGAWEACKPNKGFKAYVYVRPGYCADWTIGGHINESIWTGTDESRYFQNWIEMGYTYGFNGQPALTWYWARTRPGKPYQEWAIGSAIATGEWHWLRIQYISNDQWGVYLDGNLKVTCSPATPDGIVNSECLEAGLESSSTASSMGTGFDYPACAVAKDMQYWRASENTWYWGLRDTSGVYGQATTVGHEDSWAGCYADWLYTNGVNDYSNIHSWKVVP